jgi:Terminase RNaseH-like domain
VGRHEGVPTAWPADGLQHEKARDGAVQQRKHYIDAGFKMLAEHATWPEGGNSVESGIYGINNLMTTGKFKVFAGLHEVLEEIRQYHRNDQGKIVKIRDDLIDAIRYAYMMRRFAIRVGSVGKAKARPQAASRKRFE